METNQNNATAIIDAVKNLSGHEIVGLPDGSKAIVLPAGKKLESIKRLMDEYADAPDRKSGTATLTALDSFIEHTNRFKDEHSVVFADVANQQRPRLISVLDYHEAGEKGGPRFGKHRGIYPFPVSDQWKTWTGATDPLSQGAFAEFLEDNVADVLDPSSAGKSIKDFADKIGVSLAGPQKLMELSRGLSIAVGQRVKQAINLSSGEMQVAFAEEHSDEAGKPLKVPGGFAIGIPVFQNGPLYQIPVRLRYRPSGGQVTWAFSLHRTDLVWEHAVSEACAAAKAGTELTLLRGTPEA